MSDDLITDSQSIDGLRELFNQVSPTPTAAPLDHADVRKRIEEANLDLTKDGYENKDLLHSSIIIFEQQRYYDAARLYLYTEKIYEDLTSIINNAAIIDDRIKRAIPEFSNVGYPRTISIDEPPKSIKISILDRDASIEVEIIISYFTGKELKFCSFFQY